MSDGSSNCWLNRRLRFYLRRCLSFIGWSISNFVYCLLKMSESVGVTWLWWPFQREMIEIFPIRNEFSLISSAAEAGDGTLRPRCEPERPCWWMTQLKLISLKCCIHFDDWRVVGGFLFSIQINGCVAAGWTETIVNSMMNRRSFPGLFSNEIVEIAFRFQDGFRLMNHWSISGFNSNKWPQFCQKSWNDQQLDDELSMI